MSKHNLFFQNLNLLFSKLTNSSNIREKNLWIFGEWFGKRCCDNSLYFANYIAQHHKEITPVWFTDKDVDTHLLDQSIKRVVIDTSEALEYEKHAGVVIVNQAYTDITHTDNLAFSGAMFVNLWHGAAWKNIGVDSMHVSKIKQFYNLLFSKLYGAKYFLSCSPIFDEIMHNAYYVKKKNVIKAGFPRNSIFYDADKCCMIKNNLLAYIKNFTGFEILPSTKLITYMPTFRDFSQTNFSFAELDSDPRLISILEQNNVFILQKAHFVSSQKGKTNNKHSDRIIDCDFLSAQELLAASDVLVTDYSSCFFDYLLLDRPIIHYIYDYDYYKNNDRGLYFLVEDVQCGDDVRNIDELLCSLKNSLVNPSKDMELRANRRKQYLTYESSLACEQIYKYITNK